MSYLAFLLLGLSFYFNKKKTKIALKKAWNSFRHISAEFLGVILLVSITLSFFDENTISRFIGTDSGALGVFLSGLVGSITLIPGFIAFPTAKLLLDNGAGYVQIGAFVSTLMMVGVITYPIEVTYFGKKVTFLRNIFAFIFSFIVAYCIGQVTEGKWF